MFFSTLIAFVGMRDCSRTELPAPVSVPLLAILRLSGPQQHRSQVKWGDRSYYDARHDNVSSLLIRSKRVSPIIRLPEESPEE